MRIHLVFPNFRTGNAGGTQEPLGLMSLASALREAGHRVTLTDLTFERSLSVLDPALRQAQVLGVGCATPLFGKAVAVLQRARHINPQLLTLAGGPHATQDPADALEQGFDVVLLGEAERSAVELLRRVGDGRDWRGVRGVAYLQDGQLRQTARAPFIEDLDRLPFAARDLVDQRRYARRNGYVGIMATRGCPYKCSFCKPMQDKLFGRRVRARSPENVVREMEAVWHTYGARRFYFKDDTLLLCGRGWFERLRAELARLHLDVTWYCLGRVDQVKTPLVRVMKAAGMEAMALGVESGSQRMLDFYRKGTTPEQAREAFRILHNHRIMTHAYFMLGGPDETAGELEQTVQLARDLKPYSWRVFVVTPFPGNHLHDYAQQHHLRRITSYEECDNALNLVQGRMPMALANLTAEQIQRAARTIRRDCIVANVRRCLSQPEDFFLALQHLRTALYILADRL